MQAQQEWRIYIEKQRQKPVHLPPAIGKHIEFYLFHSEKTRCELERDSNFTYKRTSHCNIVKMAWVNENKKNEPELEPKWEDKIHATIF